MSAIDDYKGVIDAALRLCEEIARKTETPWDDSAAALARAVFDRYFGPIRFGTSPEAPLLTAAEAAGLSPIVLSIILAVIQAFLRR